MSHKIFCFWLLKIIIGVCVVNFHHMYLNSIKRGANKIQEWNVRKFYDLICHTLSGTNHKPWYTFLRHAVGNNNNFMEHIVHIQDRNVQTNRYPTDKHKKNHKTCGDPITNNLFVCRKHLKVNGMTQYNTTQWWWKLCFLGSKK